MFAVHLILYLLLTELPIERANPCGLHEYMRLDLL